MRADKTTYHIHCGAIYVYSFKYGRCIRLHIQINILFDRYRPILFSYFFHSSISIPLSIDFGYLLFKFLLLNSVSALEKLTKFDNSLQRSTFAFSFHRNWQFCGLWMEICVSKFIINNKFKWIELPSMIFVNWNRWQRFSKYFPFLHQFVGP